jgi:hypothetical protein
MPYKKEGQHFVLKLLYNNKHKRGHFIVENVFGNLKKAFRGLLTKSNLHMYFLPNVFTCNESSPWMIFRVLGFSAQLSNFC